MGINLWSQNGNDFGEVLTFQSDPRHTLVIERA
jgi:hypothetical protein